MKFLAPLSFAAAMGLASAASAATFVLDTTDGTADTMPNNYSLSEPVRPHDVFAFSGTPIFNGGLFIEGDSRMLELTYTYIGSEAGASNQAELDLGGGSFSNQTSSYGDQFTAVQTSGSYVDLTFITDNLGGGDFISNLDGFASDSRLVMAFSDIRFDTEANSLYAFFGDGAGDSDYDDIVVRIDVAAVPVPASAALMLTAVGAFGAMRMRGRKA